jgi:hypothetical protein
LRDERGGEEAFSRAGLCEYNVQSSTSCSTIHEEGYPVNAIELLKTQHEEAKKLFKKIEKAEDEE